MTGERAKLGELPPLRAALAAAGLTARKRFGQHFLLDLNVTRKIARLAGPLEGEIVVEVGPGPGGLTRAPLEAGVYRLTFQTGAYFTATGRPSFYPRVQVTFEVTAPDQHHHVPLLLSPFGYSPYRGS